MKWYERTMLYSLLAFMLGWLYLLHGAILDNHNAIVFLFRLLAGIMGGR